MDKQTKGWAVVNGAGEMVDVYGRGKIHWSEYAAKVAARRAGDPMWGGSGKHKVIPITITSENPNE